MTTVAILILSQRSLPVAERIAAAMKGAAIHGLTGRTHGTDMQFSSVGGAIRALFMHGTPIIALCAAGIVIRALAPILSNKRLEPPVLAVAEDGSAVVPLLGGLAGVNRLGRTVAEALGVSPAITTSGEIEYGVALEDPPHGYTLANPDAAKSFMADLLAGARLRIETDPPAALPDWLADCRLPIHLEGSHAIRITARQSPAAERCLHYVPRSVTLALAAEPAAGQVAAALTEAGLAPESAAMVVMAVEGASAAALDRLEEAGQVVRLVEAGGDLGQTALEAAGPGAVLLKTSAEMAIAEGARPVPPASVGRDRGGLAVVGLGPGAAEWLTPEARDALRRASDLFGYGPYLEQARRLLGPEAASRHFHTSDNREELDRARDALALAARGNSVALVSSGDPGIFAMAAALFEVLEESPSTLVRIAVLPGISAAQAAAARAGAPLGHDFCVLSLSDRLKPWAVIERRLEAAGAADLVLALYNPTSRARPWQLDRARDILLRHRAAQTPVLLARSVGRSEERLDEVTLGTLDSGEVDMSTVVLVGSSTTRGFSAAGRHWLYTPRSYKA